MLIFENDRAVMEYCRIRLLGLEVEFPEGVPATEEDMRSFREAAEQFLRRKAGNLVLLSVPDDAFPG